MFRVGTRVLIGIPTTKTARRSIQWIDGLSSLQMPLGSSAMRAWIVDTEIGPARNQLVQQALDSGAEYLFFISDDVIAPPNTLLQLLDKIGREYPVENGRTARAGIITGVYWTKTAPTEPYIWRGMLQGAYRDWTVGEFFPVDFAGCDCLMIEASVLRGMVDYWHEWQRQEAATSGTEPLPFPGWFSTDWVWNEGERPSSIATEDFYFYTLARKAGYRLFCDTAIQCLHEDRTTGHLYGLTTEMPQAGGVPEFGPEERPIVADLGAGTDSPYLGEHVRIIRFDGREDVSPDVRCDIRAIPEQWHGQFDIVHARHVLEHFPRKDAPAIVKHWARLLKPDAELRIIVPNVLHACRLITRSYDGDTTISPDEAAYAWDQLYGGQHYDTDYHKNGFTPRKLEALLQTVPALGAITVEETEGGQNVTARARRTRDDAPIAIIPLWREIAAAEATPDAPHGDR